MTGQGIRHHGEGNLSGVCKGSVPEFDYMSKITTGTVSQGNQLLGREANLEPPESRIEMLKI